MEPSKVSFIDDVVTREAGPEARKRDKGRVLSNRPEYQEGEWLGKGRLS